MTGITGGTSFHGKSQKVGDQTTANVTKTESSNTLLRVTTEAMAYDLSDPSIQVDFKNIEAHNITSLTNKLSFFKEKMEEETLEQADMGEFLGTCEEAVVSKNPQIQRKALKLFDQLIRDFTSDLCDFDLAEEEIHEVFRIIDIVPRDNRVIQILSNIIEGQYTDTLAFNLAQSRLSPFLDDPEKSHLVFDKFVGNSAYRGKCVEALKGIWDGENDSLKEMGISELLPHMSEDDAEYFLNSAFGNSNDELKIYAMNSLGKLFSGGDEDDEESISKIQKVNPQRFIPFIEIGLSSDSNLAITSLRQLSDLLLMDKSQQESLYPLFQKAGENPKILDRLDSFVRNESDKSFLKLLIQKNDPFRGAAIETYYSQVSLRCLVLQFNKNNIPHDIKAGIEKEITSRAMKGEIAAINAYFLCDIKCKEHAKLFRHKKMIQTLGLNHDKGSIQHITQSPKGKLRQKAKVRSNGTNGFGSMVRATTPLLRAFYEASKDADIVADVGCADGWNLIPVFENAKKTTTIAIDMNKRLLREVDENFKRSSPGTYVSLNETANSFQLQPNSVDTMLSSHVMHYLKEEEIVDFVRKGFVSLKPGGKLFIQMLTPWCYNSHTNAKAAVKRGDFASVQECLDHMVEKQNRGESLHGMINNSGIEHMNNLFTAEYFTHLVKNHPKLKSLGLQISCEYSRLDENEDRCDGGLNPQKSVLGVQIQKRGV